MKPELIKQSLRDIADLIGGEYRETHSGTPHVIATGTDCRYSLVYAALSKKWKAFYPWPAPPSGQTRVYFKNEQEMLRFLREKGCVL